MNALELLTKAHREHGESIDMFSIGACTKTIRKTLKEVGLNFGEINEALCIIEQIAKESEKRHRDWVHAGFTAMHGLNSIKQAKKDLGI